MKREKKILDHEKNTILKAVARNADLHSSEHDFA